MSDKENLHYFLCDELYAWVTIRSKRTLDKLLLQASDKFETSQLPSPVTSQSATKSFAVFKANKLARLRSLNLLLATFT